MNPAIAFLILAAATGAAFAQQTPDNTISALLSEVRQLRLALERSAVVAPKIQVTLQRMQLQQDAVSRVSRQLEDVRDQIAKSATEEANLASHVKGVEEQVAQEQDPARRKQMENELKHLRTLREKTEQKGINEAQQRARESELAGRLQTEQARLNELNDRLSTLERQLESPQARQP
jgi:chromosome segregation ATPase